jgi:hypothetical protein
MADVAQPTGDVTQRSSARRVHDLPTPFLAVDETDRSEEVEVFGNRLT